MSDELAGRYLDGLAAAVTVALRAQLDAGQVPAGPWPAPRMTVDDLPPGFGSLPESTGVAVLDYALAVLAAQWPHVEDEDEALERVASTRAAALAALDGRPILLPGDEAPPGWVEQCEAAPRF